MREQFACMVRVQSCCMCAGFARESLRPAESSAGAPFRNVSLLFLLFQQCHVHTPAIPPLAHSSSPPIICTWTYAYMALLV